MACSREVLAQWFPPDEREELAISGLTSDEAAIAFAESLVEQHVGAWYLKQAGKEHIPIADAIILRCLSTRPYTRVWYPQVEAAFRWARLGPPDREVLVHRYNTAAGRTIRRHTPTPFERAPWLARGVVAPGRYCELGTGTVRGNPYQQVTW
jgi:hypothetical protein